MVNSFVSHTGLFLRVFSPFSLDILCNQLFQPDSYGTVTPSTISGGFCLIREFYPVEARAHGKMGLGLTTTDLAEMAKRMLPTEKSVSRDYHLIWGISDQELLTCESLALEINERKLQVIIRHNL